MRLAIHFDCSCIYRQYRNNFDQMLQNKSDICQCMPPLRRVCLGPKLCLSKVIQFGFLPWKPCFFSPWNLLWNSCSTEAKSEWTFFLGLRWIKLVSAPRQQRSAFEPELNLLENVPFFFSSVTEIRAIVTSTHVHIWKSLCTKKIYYINKFLRFSGNRHLLGEGKKVRYLEKK